MSTKQVIQNINSWAKEVLDHTNVHEILVYIGITENDGKIYKHALNVQEIISGFNVDLRNMFDNFVCFHGDRDALQMTQFPESAYQRAKHAWETDGLHLTVFGEDTLEVIKTKLFKIYKSQNKKIIKKETSIIEKAVAQIQEQYEMQLQHYVNRFIGQYRRSNFEQINDRMVKQSIAALGVSLRYGGKINNILLEKTIKMKASLTELFEKKMDAIALPLEEGPHSPKTKSEFEDYLQRYYDDMADNFSAEADELKAKHDRFIEDATKECKGLDKEEATLVLDTHWLSTMELRERSRGAAIHENSSNVMGLYLTQNWVWCMAREGKSWSREILFRGVNGRRKAKFPAMGIVSANGMKWGYEAAKVVKVDVTNPKYTGNLFHAITNVFDNAMDAHEKTYGFIHAVNASAEAYVQTEMHQLLLVIPSWFTFSDKQLLRNSSEVAGFKKVTMLTQTSVIAYHLFNNCLSSPQPIQDVLVLLIIARVDIIRLEIFGCNLDNGETTGVKMIAVTSATWPHGCTLDPVLTTLNGKQVEIVKTTYGRALHQLDIHLRNSVKFYHVIPDFPKWINLFDSYFKVSEKLEKKPLAMEDVFPHVFSLLSSDPNKLDKFLEILARNISSGPPCLRHREAKSIVSTEKSLGEETLKQKNSLLQKCNYLDEQIKEGKIEGGKVTMRSIRDAIAQGRLAAEENLFDGAEAREVDALFRQYNFKKDKRRKK